MENDDLVEFLETIELNVKMRGYDQIEVDEIFDRVCDEVKALRENLKNSEERGRVAEDHLDSETRRITEKEKEVERLLEEAKEESKRIRDDSLLKAENLRSLTEAELKSFVSEERSRITAELAEIVNKQRAIEENISIFEHQFVA
ncbi:MAG: hypothetical protein CL440_08195, partial [Acidimicrobiaceae bacterium]|nr:hypothetical protein [Acidimicrobiaceae bacterium]